MCTPFGEGVGDSIGVDVEAGVTMAVDVILTVGVTVDVTVTVENCGVTESLSIDGVLVLLDIEVVSLDSCCVVLTSDVTVGESDMVTVADTCDIEMTICNRVS